MFQPGEEGHHGARFMLDEGLLDVPALADGTASPVDGRVRAAHHVDDPDRLGEHARRADHGVGRHGAHHACTGKGGHASEPHRALDPIPVACEIVQALQLMVTRSIDVFDPSVVTVGQITAGTTNNVIPETAEIDGTIRAVSERTRAKVHDGIRRVADGIAAAHGCDRRGATSTSATRSRRTTTDFADVRARRSPATCIGAEHVRPAAAPGDGRRGLQLRAAERCRGR